MRGALAPSAAARADAHLLRQAQSEIGFRRADGPGVAGVLTVESELAG